MKRLLFVFSLILSLFLLLTICHAETVKTTLTITESSIIKDVTSGFLGINDNWSTSGLYTDSSASLTLSDKYKNTVHSTGVPINLIRMAGADAHEFNWKDSLGPLEKRANGSNLGLVEWIKFNKELNPDVELTFTINIIEDSIDDHKDLVRFLLLEPDDPNATDENGFNWAQYRVDLGLEEPVNIKIFELGNEVYYDYVEGCKQKIVVDTAVVSAGVEEYIADCKEIISAMKSVKNDITFSAVDFSYTEANAGGAKAWNSRIVEELYKDCAYITHHEYFFDYNFYWITYRLKERLLDYIDALPVADAQKPRVYISEYGYWMDKSLDNKRDGTCLSGTLTMAKYLNFLLNTPYVEIANIHVTNEGISSDDYWHSGWDLFRYYDDGNIYPTVPTEMLKIFNMALEDSTEGTSVITTKLSGSHKYWANYRNYPDDENTPNGILNVSGHKTKDGGINLLLVNSSDTVEHQLSVSFGFFSFMGTKYKLVEKAILTSDNLTDNNLPGSEDLVYVKKYDENDTSNFTGCTVPAKSILLLKLIPVNDTKITKGIDFVGDHRIVNNNVYVGKNFGLQMSVFENEDASIVSDMDLYIIKDSITPEAFIETPELYMDDVVYVSSSQIKRNYVYFDIFMPDSITDGKFYAIYGNPQTNLYDSTAFYYNKNVVNKDITNIRVSTISKRNDGDAYCLTYSADANFEDEPVAVRIYKKSAAGLVETAIVHVDSIIAKSKINEKIEIPAGSIAGDYILDLMWEDQGSIQKATYEFEFEKVDELVSISELPTTEGNNVVTLENIVETEKVFVTLKNNTNNSVNAHVIIAEYGSNGNLISANFSNKELPANSGTSTAEVVLNGIKTIEAGGYIKLFVWKDNNVSPLVNVTYVK